MLSWNSRKHIDTAQLNSSFRSDLWEQNGKQNSETKQKRTTLFYIDLFLFNVLLNSNMKFVQNAEKSKKGATVRNKFLLSV